MSYVSHNQTNSIYGIILEMPGHHINQREDQVMKTRFFFVFILLLALNLVLFAAPAELDIRMSDNAEMIVIIDDYSFDDGSGRYHITGLSHGYHNLEVYRLMYNSLNPHNEITTQLIYSGRIYLQSGYRTFAEVDRTGRLYILRKEKLYPSGHVGHYNNNGHYGNHGNNGNNSYIGGSYGYGGYGNIYGMEPAAFAELKHTIARTSFDSSKLEMAKFAASRNRMNSAQIAELTDLLSFDSSRLEFAKFAYHYVADPGSYFVVANTLTFSSSKRELFEYIGYGSGY